MATKNNNLSLFNPEDVPNSEGMRIAIIVSEWNSHITENLFFFWSPIFDHLE